MNQTNALNIEAHCIVADIAGTDIQDAAYNEGAFYAESDWQHCRKRPGFLWGPDSMAEHCAVVWADIVANVSPQWDSEQGRISFHLGYEDRATELADAGEVGYEALAEAGTVADTEGWILQSEPWATEASNSEKALRAVRAAWAGATRWQALAEASGEQPDAIRALDALIRAEAAAEYMLDSQYVTGSAAHAH